MRRPEVFLAGFLVIIFALPPAASQDKALRFEFRTEIEQVDPLKTEPLDPEMIRERIIAEAKYGYSGMIWGFRFSYVPLDRTRKIAESFTMTPSGTLPPGSPRLTLHETRREGNWFYAYVEYALNPEETGFLESWKTSLYPRNQASGSAPAREWDSRFEAVKDAMRMAVREYARGVTLNKPREVTGWCSFDRPPNVTFNTGQYFAYVKTRLKIEEIRPYGVY